MRVDTNIRFDAKEQEAISIIREVIEKYTPSTKCYIVGGIIRDKLIGLPAHDLDLMISPIKAEDFAKLITKHLNIKDPHVIKENPEKSRYISTSKLYLPTSYGIQEIDIAQARSDVYKEGSRIPETKPATPEEDSFRRDLTVNSIMFDIKENKIVDFTGKGIQDLITNTIRTPQNPLKTFSDDPLRIFRVIVYASKLNGKIDPETYQAMLDPSLRNEIKNKVSKERLGQEFLKMMRNPNAEYALKLLKNTGLLEDIIAEAVKGTPYEGKMAEFGMNQENPNHKLTLWGHTMEVVKGVLEKYQDAEPEKRVAIILAALMHDIGKLYQEVWADSKSHPGHRSYHGHEDESAKIVELILKYLKIEPYIQQVAGLAQSHMRPHGLIRNEGGAKALRKFIRQIGEQSLNWIDVLNLSIADAYAKDTIRDPNTIQIYQDLEQRLQEALVSLSPTPDKPELKPILNGNEIMKTLNIKAGPHMKEMMEFVKELRDDNPNITKEEATQKLKEKFQQPEIKQASKKSDASSVCPRHLLNAKIDEINTLLHEQKYYEVLTLTTQLKEEYGNDDNITRLVAITCFKLLVVSEKYRHNDLLQYALDKAQLNFFDYILCSYSVGILLLIETQTEDDIVKEIAQRMVKMSPGTLRNVLDSLPKNIFRPKLKKEIEIML
jgi:tRNA nucleotidyltransferase (CCA-adding enzyme)